MITKIGRFEVNQRGEIHLQNEGDERELFAEIDNLSKKYLKELPVVVYDYKKSDVNVIKRRMI